MNDLDDLIKHSVNNAKRSGNPPRRYWTKEEDDFIRDNLGEISQEEIAKKLNRTEKSVKVRWTRLQMDAPSKRDGFFTRQGAARALGTDVKCILNLCNKGILPFTPVPGCEIKNIQRISVWALTKWATDPMNWPYFRYKLNGEPRFITDPAIRQLIKEKEIEWGDEWWTTGKAGKYLGLRNSHRVNFMINKNRFKVTNNHHNWKILKSEVVAYKKYRDNLRRNHGK